VGAIELRPKLKSYLEKELNESMTAIARNELDSCWIHLERAHILSQAYPWPHVRVHLWMLYVGLKKRDLREIVGQVARTVVAAPGSWLGRAPPGNTGGANVGILQPMPIPDDLRAILEGKEK
jgi:hypothetical protein